MSRNKTYANWRADRAPNDFLLAWYFLRSKASHISVCITLVDGLQAILAMPFFSENGWLKHVDRFWLWIALTIPSTTLCFLFYMIWSGKESRRRQVDADEEELAELDPRTNGR